MTHNTKEKCPKCGVMMYDPFGGTIKIHDEEKCGGVLNYPVSNTKEEWEDEFIEKGADLEHDRWSKWQEYMHSKVYDSSESLNPHLKVIPTESYNHWERQIKTKYSDLSEKEKESDRIEVRKYLPLIKEIITSQRHQERVQTMREMRGKIIDLLTSLI